jgi:hypothetical protein
MIFHLLTHTALNNKITSAASPHYGPLAPRSVPIPWREGHLGRDEMTQNQMILEALENGEKLTPMDAIKHFGCTKLSTRIGELKREGHPINGKFVARKNRFGKIVHVQEYWHEDVAKA